MKKIILLGNKNTGKSTFLQCLRPEKTKIKPTIGIHTCTYNKTLICDTSGDIIYQSIVQSYYSYMDLFVFVYKTPIDLMFIHKIKPKTGNLVIVYNGDNEKLLDEGFIYARNYNMKFFSCDVVNTIDSKWTWNRIFEILELKEVTKTDKGWRYCWFY